IVNENTSEKFRSPTVEGVLPLWMMQFIQKGQYDSYFILKTLRTRCFLNDVLHMINNWNFPERKVYCNTIDTVKMRKILSRSCYTSMDVEMTKDWFIIAGQTEHLLLADTGEINYDP